MNRIAKKLFAAGLAGSMTLSMGLTAFAAEQQGPFDAKLYKTGTTTLSMGDGALFDAVYTETSGGIQVTVNVDEGFKAYGMSGSLTKVYMDTDGDGVINKDVNVVADRDGNDKTDALIFTYTGPVSDTENLKIKGDFTISVLNFMPMNSIGDLVIENHAK